MNKIVTMLPIKPQSNLKTGLFLTPLYVNIIADLTGAKSVLMINLLHSFKDYKIHKNIFIESLFENELSFDKIDSDINNIDKYEFIIKDMYNKGLLKKESIISYICDCGKVDIRKENLFEMHNKKIIEKKEDEYICSFCKSELHMIPSNVLYLDCSSITNHHVNIFPNWLKANLKNGFSGFNNSKLVITKNRNTGVSINVDEDKYNIDIDFLLYLTPLLFNEEDITIICCNRHLLHTLFTNYINDIYGHKKLRFIEHPYINSQLASDSYLTLLKNDNKNLIKASLIASTSWSNYDCKWDEGKFKYLCKNKQYLKETLEMYKNEQFDVDSIISDSNNILTKYGSIINNLKQIKQNNNLEQ